MVTWASPVVGTFVPDGNETGLDAWPAGVYVQLTGAPGVRDAAADDWVDWVDWVDWAAGCPAGCPLHPADRAATANAHAASAILFAILIVIILPFPHTKLVPMVNLTRIYTRTGDQGTTRLANNDSVAKTDPRLEAYGTVDEANCAIGVALSLPDIDTRLRAVLTIIQNDLFDVGADLATPLDPAPERAVRVAASWIERLEGWCDEFSADLPNLKSFVLPGGVALAAHLNTARAVVRRAERASWAASESVGVNPLAIRYLNRLSDLLFIMGRYANLSSGGTETLWTPARSDQR